MLGLDGLGFLGGRVAISCKTMSKSCKMLPNVAQDGQKLHKFHGFL